MTTDILARAETEFSAMVIIEISSMLGRRRMSQAALARALNVKPMWLSDRMTGRVRMTLDDLDRIADGLQVGIVDLLPRERRSPTLTLAEPSRAMDAGWSIPRRREPVVSGTVAHPGHPIVSAAVRIPAQRTTTNGVRRTAPTGL